MLRTLRNRLILSHVLPLLIVIPLVGVALIYALETQFILPALSHEVEQDARLLGQIVAHHAEVWQDPAAAQHLLGPPEAAPAKRVMLLDRDHRILACNDQAEMQLVGTRPADVDWQSLAEGRALRLRHLDPASGTPVVDVFVPVLDGGGTLQGIVRVSHPYTTIAADLLRLRNLISLTLIAGLSGGTLLAVILAASLARPLRRMTDAVYDLAQGEQSRRLEEEGPQEVRRLLQALNHLVDRRRELETARLELLANLVHELGRPLGTLRISLQALRRGAIEDPDLRDEFLDGIDESARRIETLVDDLLGLQDQMLGMLELKRQRVQLAAWLPEVLRPWKAAALEKGLQWRLETVDSDLWLLADRGRLSQALGNLAANAVKYTPRGGQITIAAGHQAGQDEEGEWVWIRVCDTGPGIPAGEQEAIFEPFRRGERQQATGEGMGLGLNIARRFVNAHGGRLELESEPGRGSTFTIWLPGGIG